MRNGLKYISIAISSAFIISGCSMASDSETTATSDTEISNSVSSTVNHTTEMVEQSTETSIVDVSTDEQAETSEDITTEAFETGSMEETTEEKPTETTWSPSSLMNGIATSIEYDQKYNAVVGSAEDAIKTVKMYGDMQKATYDNPPISVIEKQMEDEFDIAYVALGEIDEATAKDIYDGFKYMYETYPQLQGTLTNFSLGNFTWNAMAQTRTFEFITNADAVPIVLKREIVISAASFRDREALLADCAYNVETGFWPPNATISMIIVHELGHHLLDVHNAELHGFSGNYVNKENYDAYRDYAQENLSWNQEEVKRIIEAAYADWLKSNEGSEEDFRGSISEYAKAIQHDGGVSYTETFAEAVADIYANGDDAALASRLIMEKSLS